MKWTLDEILTHRAPAHRRLLQAVGEAARSQNTAVVLFIDELQYVQERELSALIAAPHFLVPLQLGYREQPQNACPA